MRDYTGAKWKCDVDGRIRMSSGRMRVIAGTTALLVIAGAIVVAVWLAGRDSGAAATASTTSASTSPVLPGSEIAPADAARFAALYRTMTVGKTRIDVLARWPKPYQSYHDQFDHRCYEWKAGRRLYNLCFKQDLLALKDPP